MSEAWQNSIISGLTPDLSTYNVRDYRRFLSAHLQYLQGLCQLSIQSVNSSVKQFLTALFVTTQLFSEHDFNDKIDVLVQETLTNIHVEFVRILSMIRNINHGNAIISTYGSNFEYIMLHPINTNEFTYLLVQPMLYENNCPCGLYSNCTSPARFMLSSNTFRNVVDVRGLKIGCTPSESFLTSTLECFYDRSCLSIIGQSTNTIYEMNLTKTLSTSLTNRFSIDTTVNELINDLFIERWTTDKNYLSYYQRCAPLSCSYSYIEYANLLYTGTVLLGLHGGLTIVLKWTCPKLVLIIAKISSRRRRMIAIVGSVEYNSANPIHNRTSIQTIPVIQ